MRGFETRENIFLNKIITKKKSTKKAVLIIVSCVLTLCIVGSVVAMASFGMIKKGNAPKYYISKIPVNEQSPIEGETVIFLGSSVTLGNAAFFTSFVEQLKHCDKIIPVKKAVSGTTLVDTGKKSYVQRVQKIDKNLTPLCFICQLSTNDAKKNLPLGEVSESLDIKDFDTSTIIGSMEFIIAYTKETWGCPVAFYTGTKYDSENYEKMVYALYALQKKWGIGIIDLWNSDEMNSVSPENYALYMSDPIHPTLAGYRWWLPQFEDYLYALASANEKGDY